MLISLKELKGLTIQAKDGEIGKISDAYFDDNAWVIRYLIDKTGFWLFGRQVLISPKSIQAVDSEKSQLRVDLTRDQVANSPRVDKEMPLTRDAERNLIRYYKWPIYLGVSVVGTNGKDTQEPFAVTLNDPRKIVRDQESDESRIVSTEDVQNYSIWTNNGDLGVITDFIVDLDTWEIRFLIIDIGKGKNDKILIDPEWIDWISWRKRRISVSVDREKIESCPRFDLSLPIQREYEELLYNHYECKKYWEKKDADSKA